MGRKILDEPVEQARTGHQRCVVAPVARQSVAGEIKPAVCARHGADAGKAAGGAADVEQAFTSENAVSKRGAQRVHGAGNDERPSGKTRQMGSFVGH